MMMHGLLAGLAAGALVAGCGGRQLLAAIERQRQE
jgi:hypothetical protein